MKKKPAVNISGVPNPRPQPIPPRPVAAPKPIETDEQRQQRVNVAGEKLAALCKQYHVSFNVSKLDISSGKIWPIINLVALPLP